MDRRNGTIRRKLAPFLMVCMVGALPGLRVGAASQTLGAGLPAAVEKTIQSRIHAGVYVGVAVGVIDPQGAGFYSFGRRTTGDPQPIDEETVFEIGSISKVFTSILLAEMVRRGDLALDQPIESLLPPSVRIPARLARKIRFDDLATHTSGLPRLPDNLLPKDPENPYADYSVEQMLDFLSRYSPPRDPGSQYEYSNYGAGLLGYLLGIRAGSDYSSLLRNLLTEPLGMSRTSIQLSPAMISNLAPGHRNGLRVSNWDIPTLAGAGGIRSTTRDMLEFLKANLDLRPEGLAQSIRLTHQARARAGPGMEIGLGWHIRSGNQGRPIVWHNGGTGGYRSFAGFDDGRKLGVVILSNSDESVDDLGFFILDSSFPLKTVRPSIAVALSRTISEAGPAQAESRFQSLKESHSAEYDFSEGQLNSLGYQYLRAGQTNEALAVFQINLRSFPKSANAHDSLAEAYLKKGDLDRAIIHYLDSLKLDPSNQNARGKLQDMGVDVGIPRGPNSPGKKGGNSNRDASTRLLILHPSLPSASRIA